MYRIIFEHYPKEGKEEEFIAEWQKRSDVTNTYPGARGSVLFTKTDKPGVFYAMADWYSRGARDAAMEQMKKDHPEFWEKPKEDGASLKPPAVLEEFESVAGSYPPVSKWK